MLEDCDHARSQARHHGMGVRTACAFACGFPAMLSVVSPPTDDPIVPIVAVMVVSGVVMLTCIGMTIVKKVREMQAEKDREGK